MFITSCLMNCVSRGSYLTSNSSRMSLGSSQFSSMKTMLTISLICESPKLVGPQCSCSYISGSNFVDCDMVMRHFSGGIGHLDRVAQNDINVPDDVPTDNTQAQEEAMAAAAAMQAAEAVLHAMRSTSTAQPSSSDRDDEDEDERLDSDPESDTESISTRDAEGSHPTNEKGAESDDDHFDAESDYDSE
jgi:hypothetical protein